MRSEGGTQADPTREGGIIGTAAELFDQEEHPERIVLCAVDDYSARDVLDRLARSGIGALLADRDQYGRVEIVVHHTRLPEAQAIIAESLSEGPAEYVMVSSAYLVDAHHQADRLVAAGIDARVSINPLPSNDERGSGRRRFADVLVPPERLPEAKAILGIVL